MALINCPNCGSTVSEYSETCPNCGYPIEKEQKKKKLRLIALIPILAAAVLIAGVTAYVLSVEGPARRARKEWLEARQTEAPAIINLRDQPTGLSVSATRRPVVTTPFYMKESAATKRAKALLTIRAYSFSGLMRQLRNEGYGVSEAMYGLVYCGADWSEQAERKAREVLSAEEITREALYDRLIAVGFSEEDAQYGVEHCGQSW